MRWRRHVILVLAMIGAFVLSRYLLVGNVEIMSRNAHSLLAGLVAWVVFALIGWFGSERRREHEWSEEDRSADPGDG